MATQRTPRTDAAAWWLNASPAATSPRCRWFTSNERTEPAFEAAPRPDARRSRSYLSASGACAGADDPCSAVGGAVAFAGAAAVAGFPPPTHTAALLTPRPAADISWPKPCMVLHAPSMKVKATTAHFISSFMALSKQPDHPKGAGRGMRVSRGSCRGSCCARSGRRPPNAACRGPRE